MTDACPILLGEWLARAIDLEGNKSIRMLALDDPDLAPIWTDISEI
jgi:hypothetical protein